MLSKQNLWKWVTVLLSIVALSLSILMVRQSLTATHIIGCSAGSACDNVLNSPWSKIFGFFPVAGLAAGLYLCLIICVFCLENEDFKPLSKLFLLIIAGSVVGSAIWFTLIQIFILHTFCPYCMTTHLLGLIISIMIVAKLGQPKKLLMGLALAGLLAGFQLFTTPKYNYEDGKLNSELVLFYKDELPLIGNPNAEKIITLMFDYQCSHCQKIHKVLPEILSQYPDKYAFSLCPVPLSTACNPYLPLTDKDLFKGSCDLAKLSMAIWYQSPEDFYVFDQWLFEADKKLGWYPRKVDEARAKAIELIGNERLQEVLMSDGIDDFFSKSFDLFGRTNSNGRAAIPRMVYGDTWLVPEVSDAESLAELILKTF